MSRSFVSQISALGPGDLVSFRDTVITYCAALRLGEKLVFSGPSEAEDLLHWLGVDFERGEQSGLTYCDPSRKDSVEECHLLADGAQFPQTSLQDFRSQGYLGNTLFAALVRSSYGPDEAEYFPTKSELGFYFDQDLLRQGEVRWDEDFLQDCQQFFFEELTPAEMLSLALAPLPQELREGAVPFEAELLGVAFLVGEQATTLGPLSQFFRNLLSPEKSVPELKHFISLTPSWDETTVSSIWEMTDPELVETLKNGLFAPVADQIPELLVACGETLITWRAGS